MLLDILTQFCNIAGYDIVNDRVAALDYINRGAKDLHNSLEADALMREVILVATSDMQVTLPTYIGEVRGLREYNGYSTFALTQIGTPRYTSDTWKYKWRNWTQKGKVSTHTNIVNAGPLILTTNATEGALVTVTGKTQNSNRIFETVSMNQTTVQTVNSWAGIESIISPTDGRTQNITVSDIQGNELAILYNNERKTEYLLMDVSRYSWSAQTGDGVTILAEVLYKCKFYKLYNDTDEFGAEGYDDAILFKALEFWCHGKDGKEQDEAKYRADAKLVCDNNTWSKERGENPRLAHEKDPVYNVMKRLRFGWGSRRRWWRQ